MVLVSYGPRGKKGRQQKSEKYQRKFFRSFFTPKRKTARGTPGQQDRGEGRQRGAALTRIG